MVIKKCKKKKPFRPFSKYYYSTSSCLFQAVFCVEQLKMVLDFINTHWEMIDISFRILNFAKKNRLFFDHFPSLQSLKNVEEVIFATFQNLVISRLPVVFSSRVLNRTKGFYSPHIHIRPRSKLFVGAFSLALKSTILYQVALQQPFHI